MDGSHLENFLPGLFFLPCHSLRKSNCICIFCAVKDVLPHLERLAHDEDDDDDGEDLPDGDLPLLAGLGRSLVRSGVPPRLGSLGQGGPDREK